MINFFRVIKAYAVMSAHFSKVIFQLLYGIGKLAKLKKAPITIFGGHLLAKDSIYIKMAEELSIKLADRGIPVLTGGGPGIMEAVSCATANRKGKVIATIGIGLKSLPFNKCVKDSIVMDYFFARKWLLIKYSSGFAVFPGGFGTLDELAELLTLVQNKLQPPAPIVLIGKDYWHPFMDWVYNSALKQGLILEEDAALFTITDDINEALNRLYSHCAKEPFNIYEHRY